MILNPLYEIVRDLGIAPGRDRGLEMLCRPPGDLRPRVMELGARRPELNPFLVSALSAVSPSRELNHYALKDALTALFSYAIPTPEAIAAIAKRTDSVVEIGAGSGYWSALLHGAGVRVSAFDNGSWKLPALWHEVRRGGTPRAAKTDAKALLLCWPPHASRMAYDALRSFRGDLLAYVGESGYGCTGDARFHDLIDREWRHEITAPSVQWPGLHDYVYIYRRAASVLESAPR
jgi:hypothetical protein